MALTAGEHIGHYFQIEPALTRQLHQLRQCGPPLCGPEERAYVLDQLHFPLLDGPLRPFRGPIEFTAYCVKNRQPDSSSDRAARLELLDPAIYLTPAVRASQQRRELPYNRIRPRDQCMCLFR